MARDVCVRRVVGRATVGGRGRGGTEGDGGDEGRRTEGRACYIVDDCSGGW